MVFKHEGMEKKKPRLVEPQRRNFHYRHTCAPFISYLSPLSSPFYIYYYFIFMSIPIISFILFFFVNNVNFLYYIIFHFSCLYLPLLSNFLNIVFENYTYKEKLIVSNSIKSNENIKLNYFFFKINTLSYYINNTHILRKSSTSRVLTF